MKVIIQINSSVNNGSTGRIAEQCNVLAVHNGFDAYFAYSRHCFSSKSKIIKIGNICDIIIDGIETRLFDMAGLGHRYATKKLIHQIQKLQPDIVHLHNIHGYVLNYKLLFEYLNTTNIQIVWTFHDFWAVTGHCAHFTDAQCRKWQTECYDCPIHKTYPTSITDFSRRNYLLKKKLFKANNNLHIVAVSDWVGNIVKQSFLKDKDIRVISNGIDLNVFKPTKGFIHPRIKDESFIIMGVASQWINGKGLLDFVSISKLMNDDELIVLVGLPDNVISDLPDNVIGIKRVYNQQEMAALYTRANVVTSLSSAETFGLTIIEGYACGTPAVVYDNTALPALITTSTGFVVPDKNYKAAYEAIQRIKVRGKDYYSEACITLAKEKYNKDICFSKYIELYNEIIPK